jgi:inner membrane protein
MPTIFTHAAAAAAIGAAFQTPKSSWKFWFLGVLCGIIPDFDVIGFRFGVQYGDFLGHRGFSHSIVFAIILAGIFSVLAFPEESWGFKRWMLFGYFFLATISHALLDMLTSGGLGVAIFAPFDNTRYFFPSTPIRVAPFSARALLTERGFAVLKSEFFWVWIPAIVFVIGAVFFKRLK